MNNNPVFESMIKVLQTYAGKKIFPPETPQGESMRQRWADHKSLKIHGKLEKQ
jgi:hypothetical protein